MKQIITFLAISIYCGALSLSAQNAEHPNALMFKRLLIDYTSPNVGGFTDFDRITGGWEVDYIRNFNKNFNVAIPLKVGVIRLPEEINNRTITGLDIVGQLQYYTEENVVTPYIMAGLGGVMEDFKDLDIQIPLGVGFNIKLWKFALVNVQGEYRKSIADGTDNIHYGVGLGFILGALPKEELPEPLSTLDSDQDGIVDTEDQCPQVAGLSAFFGCPDTDRDGIMDKDDACPTVAGDPANKGCPILDSDGDGVLDADDKCPQVAGTAKGCPDADQDKIADQDDACPNEFGLPANNGCPAQSVDSDNDGFADNVDACPTTPGNVKGCPDSDQDGVADKEDKCPTVAGVIRFMGCPDTDGDGVEDAQDNCPKVYGAASNQGCPVITKAEKAILDYAKYAVQFETNKATLKASSYEVLDQVSSILKTNSGYYLTIEGHTDNKGTESFNQDLSLKRAKACYDYLRSKGILGTRVGYGGFGETQPISTNDTEEGRALNRRVEFRIDMK